MQTVILSKEDGHVLKVAVQSLAKSAPEANKHDKAVKAAKAIIARELEQKRGIKISDLADKEIIIVKCNGADVLKVERKSSQRLDQAGLTAKHPDLIEEFTKPSPATYFSPLFGALAGD